MPATGTNTVSLADFAESNAKVGVQLLLNREDKERAQMLAFVLEESQAEALRELLLASLPHFEETHSVSIERVNAKLRHAGLDVPSAVDALLKARIKASRVLELDDATLCQILGVSATA